jgi:hypothetical protein
MFRNAALKQTNQLLYLRGEELGQIIPNIEFTFLPSAILQKRKWPSPHLRNPE